MVFSTKREYAMAIANGMLTATAKRYPPMISTEVIQAPQLMAADLGQALQALQLPGVNVQVYVVAIEGLFGVFLALLFVSAWMKFPLT